MNKQNVITITLIITGLALSPIMAEEAHYRVSQKNIIKKSITSSIAKVLHKRGLDEDVSEEMAEKFIDDKDEILLATMIHHLELHDIVTRKEVLQYLSDSVLHRQKIDFKSYDHVLGMVSKIRQKSLDSQTRKYLSYMVKINKQLFV